MARGEAGTRDALAFGACALRAAAEDQVGGAAALGGGGGGPGEFGERVDRRGAGLGMADGEGLVQGVLEGGDVRLEGGAVEVCEDVGEGEVFLLSEGNGVGLAAGDGGEKAGLVGGEGGQVCGCGLAGRRGHVRRISGTPNGVKTNRTDFDRIGKDRRIAGISD